MLPPTPTQHDLVGIRLQCEIFFVTSFTSDSKSTIIFKRHKNRRLIIFMHNIKGFKEI
jgi:hypothetical protein